MLECLAYFGQVFMSLPPMKGRMEGFSLAPSGTKGSSLCKKGNYYRFYHLPV